MNIYYILTIIFMILILILGIMGIFFPNKIINYYLKYTNNHPKVIEIINKNWFQPSFKISSILLILYSLVIIFLIAKKELL
ncbi:hypothetical protein CHA01nite_08180 [Chryseobacterium hagamense]|uniref:Uncharacterized protein n=1 Tax=Chryseobacterium hagamense TaxID=395935 RepID=A0A511YIQ2_9FLAO|nr:hypothetical protein CHA01nite_08180 [Chryseobacterium hagamense]